MQCFLVLVTADSAYQIEEFLFLELWNWRHNLFGELIYFYSDDREEIEGNMQVFVVFVRVSGNAFKNLEIRARKSQLDKLDLFRNIDCIVVKIQTEDLDWELSVGLVLNRMESADGTPVIDWIS